MTITSTGRLEAIEAFVVDMFDAAATLDLLSRAPAADIADLVTAYAADIRARALALTPTLGQGSPAT